MCGFRVGRACFFFGGGGGSLLHARVFYFSFLFSLSRPWGSRSARPWDWLDGVFFLFLYTAFHGWTYRTLYISCLMGLCIAAR